MCKFFIKRALLCKPKINDSQTSSALRLANPFPKKQIFFARIYIRFDLQFWSSVCVRCLMEKWALLFLLFEFGSSFQRLSFFIQIWSPVEKADIKKKQYEKEIFSYISHHAGKLWTLCSPFYTIEALVWYNAAQHYLEYSIFILKKVRWDIWILPPFLNRSCC